VSSSPPSLVGIPVNRLSALMLSCPLAWCPFRPNTFLLRTLHEILVLVFGTEMESCFVFTDTPAEPHRLGGREWVPRVTPPIHYTDAVMGKPYRPPHFNRGSFFCFVFSFFKESRRSTPTRAQKSQSFTDDPTHFCSSN